MEIRNTHRLVIGGKDVLIYISSISNSPVIYLNTFEEEGVAVYFLLREMYARRQTFCPEFTLAAISGLSWNHDMSPWDAPPVARNDTPCTGGADGYLRMLTEEIVPAVEELIPGKVLWRGLAGYSLAGLFALYTLYQTDIFARIASASGSFWFPGFQEYVFAHEMKAAPEAVYISLGDKECKTRNPYLRTVQECTEGIAAYYRERGIDTIYERNPGNHFQDAALRMASGIAWILDR